MGSLVPEMATFFGEVVTPLSRAGLDDEEELAEEREETQEDREIRLALEKKRSRAREIR